MLLEQVEKNSKNIVFIYTTCSSREEAREIGISAINEKLAISADYWFVNSIYPWKGVLQESDQCMLMLSTQKDLSEKLIKHVETMHSYSVPVIFRTDSSMTNHLYGSWVESTLESNEVYITEEEARIKSQQEEFHYSRLK